MPIIIKEINSNFRKAIPPLEIIGLSLGPVFIYPKSFQFTRPKLQNLSEAFENHLPAGNEQPATSNKQSVLLPFHSFLYFFPRWFNISPISNKFPLSPLFSLPR